MQHELAPLLGFGGSLGFEGSTERARTRGIGRKQDMAVPSHGDNDSDQGSKWPNDLIQSLRARYTQPHGRCRSSRDLYHLWCFRHLRVGAAGPLDYRADRRAESSRSDVGNRRSEQTLMGVGDRALNAAGRDFVLVHRATFAQTGSRQFGSMITARRSNKKPLVQES